MSSLLKWRFLAAEVRSVAPQSDAGITCPAESVATMDEAKLVSWLLSEDRLRQLLFEELGLRADAHYAEQVREPFVTEFSSRPGDIDILACDRGNPRAGVAIECKRVKIRSIGGEQDDVNRVRAVSKGRSQVIGLSRFGFHRTYLAVILAVDGQRSGGFNFLTRGASDASLARVSEAIESLGVPDNVGLLLVEIVQPTAEHLGDASVISVAIAKQPRAIEQLGSTTEKLVRLFGVN